ncbi:MAG: hypothetical protein BJ554DRAFT_7020 [Olpidium bornovanus]|uniref:Uncharacterized protein n=1 Tax=Olpidium bornovanus TaxID=278681 RepID=A0A8H8A1Z8_9FUNG|nr:MAG: hypothetical protein BJ554DRAFT_7020 [Olpidium bornovanus]
MFPLPPQMEGRHNKQVPEGAVHFGVGIPAGGNTEKGRRAKIQDVLEWKTCGKHTVAKYMRWEDLITSEKIVEYVARCNRAASPSDYRMKRSIVKKINTRLPQMASALPWGRFPDPRTIFVCQNWA